MGTDGGDPAEYRFDDVLVDTRARRVFKGGAEVSLEPKAYAVLLELLREPQVAIGRDRLLDAVWGHRFVTPGVLNRIIAILRRALGDDADHPRLIRTVHGVGYSFIGSLAAPDGAVAAGHGAPEVVASPAVPPIPVRPTLSWRIVVPVVLLVVALAVLAWQRYLREPATASSTPATPVARLALLPIVPIEAGDEVLARGLTDILAEALARVPEFELIELESARMAVSQTEDPRAMAALLRTDHVLRGRLGQRGEQAQLSLELVRGSDGSTVWSQEFGQPRALLTAVLDPILSALRRELLPGLPPGRIDPVVRATATAQALYLESRFPLDLGAEGRARNLALLEQAVAEDPGFALGWAALANARRSRYVFGEAGLEDAMNGAQEAVDRALALDPDLVEALVVQCMIKTNQWRSAEALGPSRRAIELAPNDARAVWVRANVVAYMGRPNESLALRKRAVELNPLAWGPVWSMANDYLLLGDRVRALGQIAAARRMNGNLEDTGGYGARIELAFGNPAEAVREYRRITPGSDNFPIYMPAAAAQALAAIGEIDQAQALLDSLKPGQPEAPIFMDAWLTVAWSAGRFAESLAWLDGPGWQLAQHPWRTVARAHARALNGDIAGALADYASALEGPADRDLVFHNWWRTRFGAAQQANWIALRRAEGLDYAAELADLSDRLDQAAAGGTQVPAIFYFRAMVAALRDDAAAADALLTEARDRGWFDPVALDVDLVWRPYLQQGWFKAQRQWQADKAVRERALLATGGSSQMGVVKEGA